MGYMASGKSTIGQMIASELDYHFIDFDNYISQKEEMTITDLFEKKGEIYFRKKEAFYLGELIQQKSSKPRVIALGGGTPCYGTNIQLLQQAQVITIYLNLNVKALTDRLWLEKEARPLVAGQTSKEALEEFVRKHLFERGFYYNQADRVIKIDNKLPEVIVQEIQQLL